MSELRIEDLGCVPYGEAAERMGKQVEARREGSAPDTLLLLEHPPVVTVGRSARPENLRWSEAELAAHGIELHRVNRGGDVTYHGPGQLVGYPVLDLAGRDLADVGVYLRGLEATLCRALSDLGVAGARRTGFTGVFVAGSQPPRKIASIGVGLRGWISYHGFALNVELDRSAFEPIVPCGLHGVEMTSVHHELREPGPDLGARARKAVVAAFEAWLR